MNVTKKKLKKLYLCCFVMIILSTLLSYYAFSLHTWVWHAIHRDPIVWDDYEVKIPANLVAKFTGTAGGVTKLAIYELPDSNKATIFIDRKGRCLANNFDSDENYQRDGEHIVNRKLCNVAGDACVWIASTGSNSNPGYIERIFILNTDVLITYTGDIESSHYLNEIVETIVKKK